MTNTTQQALNCVFCGQELSKHTNYPKCYRLRPYFDYDKGVINDRGKQIARELMLLGDFEYGKQR